MKHLLTKSVVLGLAISMVGCASNTQEQNTVAGAVAGGVVGGLAGAALDGGTAVGVGIVGGAIIGGLIGNMMDASDQTHVSKAMASGKTTKWKNQHTHATFYVKPGKYFTYQDNKYCRHYTTKAVMDGKMQRMHGIACRQADGSWVAMTR